MYWLSSYICCVTKANLKVLKQLADIFIAKLLFLCLYLQFLFPFFFIYKFQNTRPSDDWSSLLPILTQPRSLVEISKATDCPILKEDWR
jgi:hypothetical protein